VDHQVPKDQESVNNNSQDDLLSDEWWKRAKARASTKI
jgi:hypothetical protein